MVIRKIHIFHQKNEICNLLKKSFLQSNYSINCSFCNTIEVNEKYLASIDDDIDCILMDNALGNHTKELIKKHFTDIPIICLPALDNDLYVDQNVKYISEPLKISELSSVLDEIFSRKEYNEK